MSHTLTIRTDRTTTRGRRVVTYYCPARGCDTSGRLSGPAATVADLLRDLTTGHAQTADDGPVLTPRQTDMVRLLADGMRVDEIAARLFVSIGCVRTTLHNARVRLGVARTADIPAEAHRRGLLDPGPPTDTPALQAARRDALAASDADLRGTCPACSVPGIRLDSAGRVHPHTRGRIGHDREKPRCPGSEKPPVAADPAATTHPRGNDR